MTEEKLEPVEESKTISLLNQLLSYKGLIIGIAAVLTATASWFKPPDITATKATYEVLSVKVNDLTKTTEDLTKLIEDSHNEAANLRAYIEGFNNGKLANLSGNSIINVPGSKSSVSVNKSSSAPETEEEEELLPPPPPPPPSRAISAAPAAPLPSFDQVISEDMAF
jgi:hypothetical protein